jgi:hypothetical protein
VEGSIEMSFSYRRAGILLCTGFMLDAGRIELVYFRHPVLMIASSGLRQKARFLLPVRCVRATSYVETTCSLAAACDVSVQSIGQLALVSTLGFSNSTKARHNKLKNLLFF